MNSLLQPQYPTVGLMGQRRRTQQDPYALLAALGQAPVYEQAPFDAGDQQLVESAAARQAAPAYEQAAFDAGDQQFLDRYAAQGYEGSVLSAPQPEPEPAPIRQMEQTASSVNPRPAANEPSGFWGAVESILIGPDARRRRQNLPAQQAEFDRLRRLAAAMGPEAEIALAFNSKAFAESLAYQYRPVTTGAGSITSYGPQEGALRVAAPVIDRFDDRFGVLNPLNTDAGVTYTEARGPTRAETTADARLQLDRELGADRLAMDQERLGLERDRVDIARDNSGFALSAGQTRYDADGRPIASVAPRPAAAPAGSQEVVGQLQSLDTEVQPALRNMRSLLESGDVITGFGAEARLTADRALAAAGNQDARRRVAATEQYRNLSGRLRVGMAKSLGANPSNADIQLLERVTAGDIGQSREGLLATIGDGEALANRQRTALRSRAPAQSGGSGGSGQPTPEQARAELRRRGLIR